MEACGGVAVKSGIVHSLCAAERRMEGRWRRREDRRRKSVVVLSGWRLVQDGIAHRNMSL